MTLCPCLQSSSPSAAHIESGRDDLAAEEFLIEIERLKLIDHCLSSKGMSRNAHQFII